MRNSSVALIALGGFLVTACGESPVQPDGLTAEPARLIETGAVFSFITIDKPSTRSLSLSQGSSYQMAATLHFSPSGTLSSIPYASWRSSDNCIASVTNVSPSWGLVKGVASGTTRIIAEAWGRADTVTVTVEGSAQPSETCYNREWSWNYDDVSFTRTPLPSSEWFVAPGETLKKVVLFAGPKPDYTIGRDAQVTLKSELWYSKGGKIGGRGYVTFSVTDGSVATISSRGVVTGRNSGRTKVIARLGNFADTVPIYVR